MKFIGWCLLVLIIAGVGVFAWGHGEARADPVVRTARLGFRDWPNGAAPVRVLLASDVHLGNEAMDVPRLARIVAQIDALKPDVILLAGDFVAGHDKAVARKAAAEMVAPLSGLHAPRGVIAVLGNHDEDTEPVVIRQALTRAGIRVLRDDAAQAGPLIVAGIGDVSSVHSNVPKTMAAVHALHGVPIAMTHGDTRAYLKGKIALMLIGHTHCGQINLVPYGILNPYMGKLRPCGLMHDTDGITVTTAGLGTSILPLRYNAPPDLWVLTMGPATR